LSQPLPSDKTELPPQSTPEVAEEERTDGKDRGGMNSLGGDDRAEELRKNETGGHQSSPDGFTVWGQDVAEAAPRLGAAEVGADIEKSTKGQEAESESVEESVLENQSRLDALDTTSLGGGEKAVVVEGRCEVRARSFLTNCCPVSTMGAPDWRAQQRVVRRSFVIVKVVWSCPKR
jgi:hypothetical protein